MIALARTSTSAVLLVLFSLLATAIIVLGSAATGEDLASRPEVRWLRCMRALRIVRLSQISPTLLKLMRTMYYAAPAVCNITIGVFLFTFAYAQLGMVSLGTLVAFSSVCAAKCRRSSCSVDAFARASERRPSM